MSKLDNLTLLLYNKDKRDLMKLFINKRTSQLRKDIIKEIFNQEGGKPFIYFDGDYYVKDIDENKENEIKYVTYFISVNKGEIIYKLVSDWLGDNMPEIDYDNSDLEYEYLDLCSDYYYKIHNYGGGSIICTFGIYKEEIIGYKFFRYKNQDEMDGTILFTMRNLYLPYEQYLSLDEFIYIYKDFRNLGICKSLFEENIKLSTQIYNLNMFYCESIAKDLNSSLSCYDNGYFKSGYKYRISFFREETNYNIKIKLREENKSEEEIDRKVLYFKDLPDLNIDYYLLISIPLTKELYDEYGLDINKFVWHELLYKYILSNEDWINIFHCKMITYDYRNKKFNSSEFLEKFCKNKEIRALIIPTNIYIKQINTIYILLDQSDEYIYRK